MRLRRSLAATAALALTVLATSLGASAATTAGTPDRPFSATSVWNTPLGADAVVDPGSAAMVASLPGTATADIYEYGDPTFVADSSTPAATVTCTQPWGTCDPSTAPQRIPTAAQPSTGSDAAMVVIDPIAGTSCDYWQARRVATSAWTASWATCAPLGGDGTGPHGGSTGAGINVLAGLVRTGEVRAGTIGHTLSLATGNSCAGGFRAPAVKTDGSSTRSDCIPEGARLQLDPSINVDALPGITPGEKAVAHALQTYGAVNRDNCGCGIAIPFQTPVGETDPYPAAGFPWDYYDMPHIPWTRLRVLSSAGTPPAAATQAAPTNVRAVVNANKTVTVTWTAAPGATSYNVWEPSHTPSRPVGTVTGTSRTSGVLASGSYTYQVEAVGPNGTSARVAATPSPVVVP